MAPTTTLRPYAWPSATAALSVRVTAPAETPPVPTATPRLHAVQAGETMIGIAVRYGVSLDDLLIANPEIDPGFLTIGQELIIPGPDGSAVSALLPTPTPVEVETLPVRCFPAPTGATWCITQVHNPTGMPLEGVSLMLSLVSTEGEVLDQISAYAPLDIIPDEGVMPFAVLLDQTPEDFAGAYTRVLGAVPAQNLDTRYPELQVQEESLIIAPDGNYAIWSGSVQIQTNLPEGTGALRAMLIAFDNSGRVVGYRLYEGEIGIEAGSQADFEITVFSLSPPISSVDLMAEVELR
ncbi:MAG: LysM peptidoglycan-binding domain-containing protein [Anaerolineales bacterium]|nr:LysM peptidoglycan-binding domain-containing protein [Anaerolineales bacterium]